MLAKSLASDQLKIRRKAQVEAANILSMPFKDDGLPSYTELLALCKGLYYSLWMQDKLLLKEEVVTRICGILQRIQNRTVLINYSSAIFETLAREWDRLDNWRVDKFMLLTRDFFTTGLQLFPQMGEEMWDQFLSVIFEKVLNKDIQHAIGLKMHICTVLGEELSKKKIKSFCIVMTLMHLVKRIRELPRHHSYGHTLLRLIHTLIRILRRHANPSLDALIGRVTKYSTQRGGYRKSFRQMANTLACICESKRVKREAARSKAECVTLSQTHTVMITDEQNALNPKLKPSKLKRKTLNEPVVKKAKKRRIVSKVPLPDSSGTHSCADVALHVEASKSDSPTAQNNVGIEDQPRLENIHPASVSTVDEPNSSEFPENTFEQVLPLTPDEKTTVITTTDMPKDTLHHVLETPSSKQRRVSFGKVFRKKFKSTQRLSMTPTMKMTPSKGILRERSSTSTKNRLSV